MILLASFFHISFLTPSADQGEKKMEFESDV